MFKGRCGHDSPCQQLCYELHDGMFECDCKTGFTLHDDGYSCTSTYFFYFIYDKFNCM